MNLRTSLLEAIQGRVRSVMQPIYDEQAAFRAESTRLLEESIAQNTLIEVNERDLMGSILFSRWKQWPNSLGSRKEAGHWLNWLGLAGEGVEVGVFQGEFSEHLLKTWQCSRLTSVDPWREFSSEEYVDTCNASQAEHDRNFARTSGRLRQFGNRSRILRATSADAATQVDDGSLDFVYIDAQHHYEAVRDDIARWHPKVKSGGVIGGHDYLDGTRPSGLYGVKRAVDEFASEAGYELIVTAEPGWPSRFAKIS